MSRLGYGMGRTGLRFHASGTLGEDHRVRLGQAGGKIGDAGHGQDGITSSAPRNPETLPVPGGRDQPTAGGRQVRCGLRQSMPSRR